MPKFRFNVYYTQGQEQIVEAATEEEAREAILNGNGDNVGDTWDVGDVDVESVDTLGDTYSVRTEEGTREWTADDADHAREQHLDAFPKEPILDVQLVHNGPHA